MTKLQVNSPALEAGTILRWLAKVPSWSSLSGQTRSQVKTLLEENVIHSLDDITPIVNQANLEGRKAKNLRTSLGIVVAGLLKGKKPDDIMGNPNDHFQIWEHAVKWFHEGEISVSSREMYNWNGEPLAVDEILQRISR